MRARRRKKDACAVPGCGVEEKVAGFCQACYSSWYRLRDMSMHEIRDYLWRKRRMIERVPLLHERKSSRRRVA